MKDETISRVYNDLMDRGEERLASAFKQEIIAKRPSKQQWKKIFRRTKPKYRKRLFCMSKPAMGRTRKNKMVWMANLTYVYLSGPRKGKHQTFKRIISHNLRKRPQRMKDDVGRRVGFCKRNKKKLNTIIKTKTKKH